MLHNSLLLPEVLRFQLVGNVRTVPVKQKLRSRQGSETLAFPSIDCISTSRATVIRNIDEFVFLITFLQPFVFMILWKRERVVVQVIFLLYEKGVHYQILLVYAGEMRIRADLVLETL